MLVLSPDHNYSPLKNELEKLEIHLLLEGMFRYYGFDFRDYALASLKRRIWNTIRDEKLTTISGLQEKVLHDPACLERFLLGLSVNVTSMFRDPSFYVAFRRRVVPLLRTYPFIRIWHAGCSTGEEVYSMAILMQEEGLYHRCRIYATDMNEMVLKQAKAGIFPLELMQEYTQNYLQAGGKRSFSEYYTAAYDHAIFRSFLKENIIFSQHNLVTDGSFNEFNVIFCRNVLIYFNQSLQQRVHTLLYESLSRFGVLGLGRQETLKFTPYENDYEALDQREKLFRRTR
ncbi:MULTISPECIES: CheR family methyltransferase [unclassified Coleofasciculus]|uniref:CheR family methyltransferase n=1 Tax=unclassified Coleofasciculus TaxID=2692782 RepID=UPI00187E41F7|nr:MULTISPECIES: protein-glutamate O-methyltransferase CheR [unclassified Coleofasciculus]MBE9127033.1 protein-glutamate O-methyltransferase CheR [Coleofasciculus sp. LEGE 07081]MBE9147288.1 protein-glutamate O-methyltransferase CheR [Coleofasciculus sp. LEGE 07092]